MTRGTWIATVALVALCGCSGGSSAGDSGEAGGYSTAKEIIVALQAKDLNCVSEMDRSGQLYTKDGWECDTKSDGGAVTAYLFSGGDTRDSWLKIAQGFGGNYVVGSDWIVDTDTPTLAHEVQKDLGGTLK
jgi:hypothetical protein